MYTDTHIYTDIRIYIYIYICICVFIYIYMYMFLLGGDAKKSYEYLTRAAYEISIADKGHFIYICRHVYI
jgi:hypothetical protein